MVRKLKFKTVIQHFYWQHIEYYKKLIERKIRYKKIQLYRGIKINLNKLKDIIIINKDLTFYYKNR